MKKFLIILGVVLFGFCLLVFLGISTSKAQIYDTAVTKVLSIPSPAFEMPTELITYKNDGVLSLTDEAKYVRAPLILPNKTRIQKVQICCKDNNASGNIRMWIHVLSNDKSESFTLCYVESTGQSNTFRTFTTTTISPNKINNVNYNYFLNLHMGTKTDGCEFLAAKIWYKGRW